MSSLMPVDILDEVRDVLLHAHRGKGDEPQFLTAYQILDRLPEATKHRLIEERKLGGKGAGVAFAAPSVVANALRQMPDVETAYIDCRGLLVKLGEETIEPSFDVCAVYRIRRAESPPLLRGSVQYHGDIVGPFHDEWGGGQ